MTEPIFLQGICKDYLWGGNRLREEFGKESDADKIAESWELACHKDGSSIDDIPTCYENGFKIIGNVFEKPDLVSCPEIG